MYGVGLKTKPAIDEYGAIGLFFGTIVETEVAAPGTSTDGVRPVETIAFCPSATS